MKYLFLCLALLISTDAFAEKASCPLSQDAKDMAVRISTVLVSELAASNDRNVLHLVQKVQAEILPPECRRNP